MSFFSIKDFIASGRKSLNDKNYWSALSVALMLPSMCSRLAYKNNPDYLKTDGSLRDKKCYIDWCNEYIREESIRSCLGEKYAEVLYNLRCDIVHAGCANIYADGKEIYLSLGDDSVTTEFTQYRIIDISELCIVIFDNSDMWMSTKFEASSCKHTRVFDSKNYDDRLLYRRLCNDERADHLKE